MQGLGGKVFCPQEQGYLSEANKSAKVKPKNRKPLYIKKNFFLDTAGKTC